MNDRAVTAVGLYQVLDPSARHVNIGRFELDPATGIAELTVLDERGRAELESFRDRGVAPRPDELLRASDGADFLAALIASYARSTYFFAVDETPRTGV